MTRSVFGKRCAATSMARAMALTLLLGVCLLAVACRGNVSREYYDDTADGGGGTSEGGTGDDGGASGPFSVGGTASGVSATGLVLQNNGGDDLTVAADGPFTFATRIGRGETYDVTIKEQPVGLTCTVTNGSGTVSADTTSVVVSCGAGAFSIGGTLSNLNGIVVVQDNGANNLTLTSDGPWKFATQVGTGFAYDVTVLTQPATQTCTVSNPTGTVGSSSVGNVDITCAANHSIGGSISNLTGSGLVLQDNGGDDLNVSAGATSFTFAQGLPQGADYAVTVKTQPTNPSQTCAVVSGGTGKVATQDITNVAIDCTTNAFTVSANVTGLSSSVVLKNNSETINPSTTGTYPFPTQVLSGAGYDVSVVTQPTAARCLIASPTGTVAASAVTVDVSCLSSFYESFEGAALIPPGWTAAKTAGNSGDVWAEYSLGVGADTGTYYMLAGGQNHVVDTTLTTPAISIVNANAQLRFRNYYNAETGWDGGVLEIKIGAGSFQDVLTAGCTFASGGYTQTLNSGTGNPLAGRSAWTGASGSYITTAVNLPASAAGQNVQLQWRWGSDSSTASTTGLVVDTVQLDR